MGFCRDKNPKLKPSKLNISKEVEFGGAVISSKLVKKEKVVCILPKDKRIQTFFDMKKSQTKKVIQSFCGIITELESQHSLRYSHAPKSMRLEVESNLEQRAGSRICSSTEDNADTNQTKPL